MEITMIPKKLNHAIVAGLTPAYRYQAGEDFAAWQARSRARLTELLGMDKITPCEADVQIEWEEERDYGREVRITYAPEAGFRNVAHILFPKETGKRPMVICLQGHSTGMHISLGQPKYPGDVETIAGGRDFALQAVREGYIAIAAEQRNFGECGGTEKGPDCFEASMSALLCGRTTIGERVWDISRLIDVMLTTFADRVDENKIVCTGNSGGGTATFYAACMDERIAVALPSCSVCTYGDSIAAMHHCACNFIPGVALDFDMGDLSGLIAPRSFAILAGAKDPIFPLPGVKKSYAICQSLYAAAGVPDRCALLIGDAGHQYYPALAWPWIREALA